MNLTKIKNSFFVGNSFFPNLRRAGWYTSKVPRTVVVNSFSPGFTTGSSSIDISENADQNQETDQNPADFLGSEDENSQVNTVEDAEFVTQTVQNAIAKAVQNEILCAVFEATTTEIHSVDQTSNLKEMDDSDFFFLSHSGSFDEDFAEPSKDHSTDPIS